MKLDKKIEAKIKQQALKLLKSGRANWDKRHTLCAVKWLKKLIKLEGGDEKILIPAIYFHDTGYEKLPLGYNHKQVMAAKPDHSKRSAENIKKFLPTLNYFKSAEISRVAYLVKNHDKHSKIIEPDRQLVFEADGLAQIDWYNCKPSYDKKNTELFLSTTFKKRMKYYKTKSGKKILKQLLAKTEKYLARWKKNK
ncbi:MAG: hypothetical protein HYV53_02750 [Parcubacteria group bacterium]|nr:hypothetical protein [Parcubacteria group bacterium]